MCGILLFKGKLVNWSAVVLSRNHIPGRCWRRRMWWSRCRQTLARNHTLPAPTQGRTVPLPNTPAWSAATLHLLNTCNATHISGNVNDSCHHMKTMCEFRSCLLPLTWRVGWESWRCSGSCCVGWWPNPVQDSAWCCQTPTRQRQSPELSSLDLKLKF